ncbi:hypothetical protein BABINDRAFT_31912 [Babjeviella inositovora NRRL Y-12698]|uniref:Activator of Hsp90 ATPase AHSA1-like N-terminal domain-containing protein n=1 Tax=Babjeviella inositovora NRRL Y-12698 TaxID=984486 RepID=A0A1E3QV98_9ASCO|nr:uncharacterized protein BABINDRAFT_31912 [Babjeviella inositovora NRRL Y-12698]ODQ81579.1 hypothetical protein BABINDRAFT_31912 [Babjeviella inositovora NRRL Y-12698]
MVVNNPNNWHWVDKNCIDWTRRYFDEKLLHVSAQGADSVAISKVSSVEGDVEVCQRKGKVISLFDIKLVLGLAGTLSDGTPVEGSITVPEIAYDSEESDLQFGVSVYNESSSNEHIKDLVKKEMVPQLRKLLIAFGRDLITAHGSDIQAPESQVKSKLTLQNQKATPVVTPANSAAVLTATSAKPVAASSSVPKYNTSTLHFEPVFNTTAEQLYITLLEPSRVAAWTRAPPNIQPVEGSDYNLFGGNISGKVVKLVQNETVNMTWRLSSWKQDHYADLEIDLRQGESDTKMVVKFLGIPVGQEDAVQNNFNEYYIKAIKITFGFGAVL